MEFESLDRCAAYVAARTAVEAIEREAVRWPPRIARHTLRLAAETLAVTTAALEHAPSSPARRRELRRAIALALEAAVACDAACALGITDGELLRLAGRTVSLLGLLFHASAAGD